MNPRVSAPRAAPRAVTSLVGLVPFAAALGVSDLFAQTAEVVVEENLRAGPNGALLGVLRPGTRLEVREEAGDWVRVALEGWMWTPSLQIRNEGDFDLVVAVDGGENLRVEPQGRILGRMEEGALFQELERIPGWIRVRREAWIWSSSVELAAARDAGEAAAGTDDTSQRPGGGFSTEVGEEGDRPGPGRERSGETWLRAAEGEVPIFSQPDGDTVGRVPGGSELRVLAREGNWGRVRMEGWVWLPGLEGGGESEPAVIADVSPDAIPDDPERFEGRLVELSLQFISLERAESVRTDFYEGEPFLLARAVDGTRIFVYVAVPPERLEEVESLVPLEEIRVLGRVRRPSAALTGSPVLDLVDLVHAP